jgi:Atg29 N-terminal domain
MAPTIEPKVHYTVIVRLPFPRGDFEDPPQVDWDATKDRKLWKIISRNPKSGDIDWADRAAEFGVTQTFLLQQAAWLYERHLSHVKAQMTKIRTSSTATTPVPAGSGQVPHPPVTSVAMKRLGSGGGKDMRRVERIWMDMC